jgi:hypothetical protein
MDYHSLRHSKGVDDQGLSLLVYGKGGDESQTRPKYQGKR